MADRLFNLGFNGLTTSQGFVEDGNIILSEEMPGDVVQQILDQNARDAEEQRNRSRNGDMGVIGARIPITLHHTWRTEWRNNGRKWGQPWHKFLKMKLNSPEYKKLRLMTL